MRKPKYHVIVCTNNRPPGHPRGSCAQRGSMDVMMKFYEELQTRSLFEDILVTSSTCIGPCDLGPTVIVYPDGVWYSRVTRDDVGEIMTKHLTGGQPVERLLMPQSLWET